MTRLRQWEECRGELRSLDISSGNLVARISEVELELPPELLSNMKSFAGSQVAILRTDRDYRFRAVT